ncbi:MAG: hypothetical protein ACP5N3_01915 [Candidatus Nanoarchaeia archaeon]
MSSGLTEKAGKLASKTLNLFQYTAAEIYIVFVLGMTPIAYNEISKEHSISSQHYLRFGERSQLKRELAAQGKTPSFINQDEIIKNDFCMKFYESIDQARAAGDVYSAFETELLAHDEQSPQRSSITKHGNWIINHTDSVVAELKTHTAVSKNLEEIIPVLSSSWKVDEDDEYDLVTETTTNSDGETETTSHWEYDHTNYDYYYNSSKGEMASSLFDKLFITFRDLPVPEIFTAKGTNADNEYAIWKSNKHKMQSDEFTGEFYSKEAGKWKECSRMVKFLNKMSQDYQTLKAYAINWAIEKNLAKPHYFFEEGRSFPGPEPYQSAQRALTLSQEMNYDERNIVGMRQNTEDLVNIILEERQNYTKTFTGELNEKPWHVMDRLMKAVDKVWEINFDESPERDFRYGRVSLILLGYSLLIAAAGKGLDWAGNRFRIYEKIHSKLNLTRFKDHIYDAYQGERHRFFDHN